MQDEGFAKRIRFDQLYAIYGGLLTDKQQKIMEQYFYDDLSLGEIAENTQTSRQAVYDLLRRVEQTLEKYESKLHLLHQDQERQFRLRGAVKLLEACRSSDSPDPRLGKVEGILKSIIDESR